MKLRAPEPEEAPEDEDVDGGDGKFSMHDIIKVPDRGRLCGTSNDNSGV